MTPLVNKQLALHNCNGRDDLIAWRIGAGAPLYAWVTDFQTNGALHGTNATPQCTVLCHAEGHWGDPAVGATSPLPNQSQLVQTKRIGRHWLPTQTTRALAFARMDRLCATT